MRIIVLAGVMLLIPTVGLAQSDAELTAEATLPLPHQLRAGARVVVNAADGSQRVLREGTNDFSCTADDPAPSFRVTCSSQSLLEAGTRPAALSVYGRLRREGLSESEILSQVSAGVDDGSIAPIPAGAMHFVLSGPDKEHAEMLIVVRLPDATGESTGLPTESSDDRAWLMFSGTHQAHVMIGSPPYGWSPNR